MMKSGKYIHVTLLIVLLSTVATADNPLFKAAEAGDLETVEKVLQSTPTVDVNDQDGDGWTPLTWASVYGHTEVVKRLLATGADPNRQTHLGGTPLLRYART